MSTAPNLRSVEIHSPADGHETPEARAAYAEQARRAGIAKALLRLRQGRPGSALRAMAQAVEHEMACHGLAGHRVHIADQMARVQAAHHGCEMAIPTRYEVTR